MSSGVGEAAAIATAVAWGISSQVQSAVGGLIGATGVTLLRQPYQIFFVTLMCLFMQVETGVSGEAFALLFVSGLCGICLSDYLLYWSMTVVGPSVAVLLVSTSTVFSAVLGWLFLQETMPFIALLGIGVIMAGIMCVLSESRGSTLMPGQTVPHGKRLALGVVMGLVAALLLSMSFILLKTALRTGVDPLWATFIRLCSGAAVLWGVGLFKGWPILVWKGVRSHPRICWMLLFSCLCGASGMWLSSLAVKYAPVGIAATLISLQTVSVTLIGAAWYRRMPSVRVMAGIIVAFAGTAMVCLR